MRKHKPYKAANSKFLVPQVKNLQTIPGEWSIKLTTALVCEAIEEFILNNYKDVPNGKMPLHFEVEDEERVEVRVNVEF